MSNGLIITPYPSWGFWMKDNPTTLYESWQGVGSLNHIFFGDISHWFYKCLAGIQIDPRNPGYKHFFIKPSPVEDLTWVEAEQQTPYGGIDYGTNSVRSLIVNTTTGEEIASSVYNYPSGVDGIIIDKHDPHLARQNPQDYIDGLVSTVKKAVRQAKKHKNFSPDKIVGIGVDTTGSTPLPVNSDGTPLALLAEFKNNPNAMAWLWKDHTSRKEAEEITTAAHKSKPDYTKFCGGTYSSEWFFAKILRLARVDKKVFNAAAS